MTAGPGRATPAHYYEPADGHGLAHDPFNAIIGPRPIGWISSVDGQGRRNLAPYSFFNAFNYHPPILGFASIGWKDTVANIAETGVFCWSLVTRDLAEAMNQTAAPVPRGRDEYALAGLTPAAGRLVDAPLVAESPVSFECRLTQLVRLTDTDSRELDTWLVLGQVVAGHIDRAFLVDGVYQAAAALPVLRWGGWGDYLRVEPDDVFQMVRPTAVD